MTKDIKQLKPSKSSRYKQGYIDPRSCKKLFPGLIHDKIIYRSSYERRFIYWCENNKDVKYWGSECMSIPYTYIDGTTHTYYPDYILEKTDGTKYVIEIKPHNQCTRPVNENSWAWETYKKNMCKWGAAKHFCESRGYHFKILTERVIKKL